jgi:hypothetical protein
MTFFERFVASRLIYWKGQNAQRPHMIPSRAWNLDKSFSPVMMFVDFLSELIKCFDNIFSMSSHLKSVPIMWGGVEDSRPSSSKSFGDSVNVTCNWSDQHTWLQR